MKYEYIIIDYVYEINNALQQKTNIFTHGQGIKKCCALEHLYTPDLKSK